MKHAVRIAAIAATVGIGLFSANATLASADETKPSVSEGTAVLVGAGDIPEAWRDNQILLDPWAQKLYAVIDPEETGFPLPIAGLPSGFAGMYEHNDTGVLDLYWSGPLPESVAAIVADGNSSGVTLVAHEDAPYSLLEIKDGMAAIRSSAGTNAFAGLGDPVELRPGHDGTGIAAVFTVDSTSTRPKTLASKARIVTDVPVKVEIIDAADDASLTAYSRQDDTNPWFGGATLNVDGYFCSSGVGVTSRGTGNNYMTTAAHCALNTSASSGPVSDGGGDSVGSWSKSSTRFSSTNDAMLVDPSSNNVGKSIFVNGWGSSTYVPITDVANNVDGQFVCTSGAMTGAHCNVVIQDHGVDRNLWGLEVTNVQIGKTSSPAGTIAVGDGDSGGPVYRNTGTSTNTYQGSIIAGLHVITCPSGGRAVPIADNRCYSTVYYSSGKHVLDDLGMDLHG